MNGYTLNLVDDINMDCVFSKAWDLIGKFTGCDIGLSEVCSTDEGDQYMVGELPLSTITVSVVKTDEGYDLQVFIMSLCGSLAANGQIAPWLAGLELAHIGVMQDFLAESGGSYERIQTA